MPNHITSEQASALGKRGAQSRKIAAIERRIRELTEAVPPALTAEQRDRLALLLRGAS